MTVIAMIVGTLFWLVIFLGFMVTLFVLLKGGFGGQALVEGALSIIIMISLCAPLALLARKLSSKVVSRTDGSSGNATNGRRRVKRVKKPRG